MSHVAIAFRHVTGGSFWSRVIRVIAGSPVHCAILFPAGLAFDASLGTGVQQLVLEPEQLAREGWEVVPVDGVDPLALRRWCVQRVGARYDALGALLYFTPLTSRDRWTCSELCAEGLVACGAPLSLLQASQTPRRLRRALRPRLVQLPMTPKLRHDDTAA